MIGERSIEGIPALTLATKQRGGIEATFVPSADMVGCSLRHRGDELLGQRGGLRTYISGALDDGDPAPLSVGESARQATVLGRRRRGRSGATRRP